MHIEFSFWLYGLRSGSTKTSKKLVRLGSDDFKNAKAFHIFYRKSPRSSWKRFTDEPEFFPGGVRSQSAKEMFIETYTDILAQEIQPKKVVKEKKPEKKAKKVSKKVSKKKSKKPVEVVEEKVEVEEEVKELKLPDVPKPPRVTLTKKQFEAQLARVLVDELDYENQKWSDSRINRFLQKMWRGYKHAPHLIANEDFKRKLVSLELVKKKKGKRARIGEDEKYRRMLQEKEVSIDSDVEGDVEIKYKEVFNHQRERRKNEPTIAVIENGLIVEKDRQTAFAQITVDYDKNIMIKANEALGNKENSEKAFSKLRNDIESVFNEAIRKGVFKPGEDPEYAIRVVVPLVSRRGVIPTEYHDKRKEKRTGHGYSTVRRKVKTKRDLDMLVNELVSGLIPAMARYVRLNHSAGYMIAGFMIERLLK